MSLFYGDASAGGDRAAELRRHGAERRDLPHPPAPPARELVPLLRPVPGFEAMRRRGLRRAARAADVIDVAPGATLARPGRPIEQIVVIESGSAALVRNGVVTGMLGAGDHFGATEALSDVQIDASLIATEASRVLVLRPQVFRSLVRGAVARRDAGALRRGAGRLSRDRSRSLRSPA